MQMIIVETFVAFGLCLAAATYFAVADGIRVAIKQYRRSAPVVGRAALAGFAPRLVHGKSQQVEALVRFLSALECHKSKSNWAS